MRFVLGLVWAASALAVAVDSGVFSEMHWRLIGPFRAGRTVAISGVVQQPNVYYMAPNNGGVWKSTDFGRTWSHLVADLRWPADRIRWCAGGRPVRSQHS